METIHPASRDELRGWLADNHRRGEAVWVATYKKATGKQRVSYDDIVEEALCFGWIDSKSKSLDEERTLIRLSPRRTGSNWSPSNLARLERLERAGLMTAAGRAVAP